ncbi:MAG: primosomal protein [Proteobacteria bacterium]|nr:primosomal protein [Pseudomonadota bacterium]
MKLIKEVHETVNYLTEDDDGKKQLFIQGPFLVAEKKNKNGRLYEYNTMKKEVHRYTEDYINKNRAFGELGHPDSPTINLDRVAILITGLHEDGTQWIGKAKVLDTPMGNIARKLIEGGAQLGVSSRGMGSLKNVNGVNVVQPDFYLATAADIVADPSAPGAFVEGIMEGKEWMLVNGVWTEMDQTQAIRQIKQASRKEIEAVSLRIFENFIKKL